MHMLLAAACQIVLATVPSDHAQICSFHWSILRQWSTPGCATPVSGTETWRVTECRDSEGCLVAAGPPNPPPTTPGPSFAVIAQPGVT